MDIDTILKNNKTKRNLYVSQSKVKKPNSKLKYFKNLISRILLTIIFVLGSIIFTNLNPKNKELYQKYVLEDSLKFTTINNYYQKLFGQVDLTSKKPSTTPAFSSSLNYSEIIPYKNGFKLTVNAQELINALASGIVVFIGDKDDLGNTIIIQGNDGVDIWYSNITDTDILVYDYVESGSIIGTSNSDYIIITLKENDKYLNYDEYISQI